MPDRPKQQLLFGGGIDRASGQLIVEDASFADLRNVYLFDGKAELRKGLFETLTFAAGEEPIHAQPIRTQGIGAVFTYKASTREVKLYQVSADGTSSIGSFLVWTLADGAPFPRISSDDSYGKVYIAHDEENFNYRQPTRVFDPVLATVADLTADLNTAIPGAVAVYFRGVARHLNYLMGWGYGTETDPYRPEILRVSMPGEPDVFNPPHYFICGQRGEPIVGGQTVGKIFMVRKETDSHRIIGSDRATFGVEPADQLFGLASPRLMVTVGGWNYFWSLDGPRRSQGGESDDLSTLLDLAGPLPDPLAQAATEYGFAVYNPNQKEVEFIFGQWAYVLHVRDPQKLRWSYRNYGIQIGAAARFFAGVSGAPTGASAPLAYADITATTPVGNHAATISWTNLGTLFGGELAEIWTHSLTEADKSWHLLADNIAVAGPGESADYSWFNPAATHEIAVRFKLGGVYNAAYVSADPTLWPAISRQQFNTPAYSTSPVGLFADRIKAGAVRSWDFHFTPQSGTKSVIETSIDPLHNDLLHLKVWTAVATIDPTVPATPYLQNHVIEAAGDQPRWYRVISMDATGANVSEYRYLYVGAHNQVDAIPAAVLIDTRSHGNVRASWTNTNLVESIHLFWELSANPGGPFVLRSSHILAPGTFLHEINTPGEYGYYRFHLHYLDQTKTFMIGADSANSAVVFQF